MPEGFADQGPLRLEPPELGELDALASSLLAAPETELQVWADQQTLGELRAMPERMRAGMDEHERRRERLITLQGRLSDLLSAASRGRRWLDEPQPENPGKAMMSTGVARVLGGR